ncbi:UNVERIFIED_CONTAM: hypothetical protein Sindi_2685500 [Sesamum indicum]
MTFLFVFAKEVTLQVDNTNVNGFLKNKLECKIEKAGIKASETNSITVRFRHLKENLKELGKKFGQLEVRAQVDDQVQRDNLDTVQIAIRSSVLASMERLDRTNSESNALGDGSLVERSGSKPAIRVHDSRPIAADSSTLVARGHQQTLLKRKQLDNRKSKLQMIQVNPTPLRLKRDGLTLG